MNLVFSLYFFIYFYRVYSETSSLLRFENNDLKCIQMNPFIFLKIEKTNPLLDCKHSIVKGLLYVVAILEF
jgi:hypothetical protein